MRFFVDYPHTMAEMPTLAEDSVGGLPFDAAKAELVEALTRQAERVERWAEQLRAEAEAVEAIETKAAWASAGLGGKVCEE